MGQQRSFPKQLAAAGIALHIPCEVAFVTVSPLERSMRYAFLIVSALVALAACEGSYVNPSSEQQARATQMRSNINSVRVGMRKSKVVDLLGTPCRACSGWSRHNVRGTMHETIPFRTNVTPLGGKSGPPTYFHFEGGELVGWSQY